VKFDLYNNNTCTGTPLASQTVSLTVSSGTGTASTTAVSLTTAGPYYWILTYSGDAYNNGFNTNCGDETTTIAAKNM
jgi:hypothetical protein